MNLRSTRTLFLSTLFAISFLPVLASAQDEPQVFTGIDILDDPIVVGVDTTFDVDIGWATLGAWSYTEVYVGNTLYGCFDTPNQPAFSSGTVTVSIPVQGALLAAGDYNLFMFQANNSSCNDAGNTLAVAACVVGGVFDVDLCPNDGLSVINESTVTVTKTFSDDNPALVPIALECTDTDAVITVDDGDADITDTAEFTVTGYVDGTTCTATEDGVPVGYTSDNSDCVDIALVSGDDSACTIDNQQNPVNVTVNKAYTVDHPVADPEAEFTLTCPTATVTDPTITTVGGVATFEVSDFPWDGEDCTATESALPGYVLDNATGCDALTVIPTDTDPADSCTITNRPTEATFTVDKNFSDDNPVLAAAVTPLCTDAGGGPGITYTPANGNALHGTNFVTTVRYFAGVTNCTASEVDLVGYTQDLAISTCDTNTVISDVADGSCVIFNDQDPIEIEASKVYSNGGGASVDFAVECTNLDSGGTVTPPTAAAAPGSPAVFTVNDVIWDGSTLCSVSEPVPPGGYYETANTCTTDLLDMTPNSDDPRTCEITNTPTRATFKVTKIFADGNNVDEIEVSIDCNTGLILDQDKDLGDGESVEFVVTSFNEGTLDCTITEDGQAGYAGEYYNVSLDVTNDESCEYTEVGGGDAYECEITNTPLPVTVNIYKDWVFEGTTAPDIDTYLEIWMWCTSEIVGGSCGVAGPASDVPPDADSPAGDNYDWYGVCYNDFGLNDVYVTIDVIPEFPTTSCYVYEYVYDGAIEVNNGCNGGNSFNVSVGQGYDCTITNTVFFEGIPTLSQYGMALLALLMLGVGFVSFRRIV